MRVLVVLLAGCLVPAPGLDLYEALLAPAPYGAIIIELDVQPGLTPSPAAWQTFITTLAITTDKQVIQPAPGSVPDHGGALTRHDLDHLHEATADHRPGPDRRHGGQDAAYLHVMFLAGGLASDGEDVATGGTLSHARGLLVVFPDAYAHAQRLDGGRVVSAAADVERTVLLHELGHAFGLVDRGLPMQVPREDPFHAGHSTNGLSVMHHGTRIGVDGILRDPVPPGFDALDRLDIAAYRERWLRD